MLTQIVPHLPKVIRTYWEPFLGSGALFFLLRPKSAVLSDSCQPLVATFQALRDDVGAVRRYLAPLRPQRELFYEVRARKTRGRFKKAAEFIYLNKSCWNGLYRVNASGKFTVPYGRPKSDHVARS